MTREEAIAFGKRVIDLGFEGETQAFCELAIEALKQEPCDKCEVGNPCLYCKHEFEPQEREE